MSLIEALILGLLQGLTEFIPVSSSGHLILAQEIFGDNDSTLAFDILLHLGTLAALLVFFRNDIWKLITNITKDNTWGRLGRLLIIATIPAGIAGLLFADSIDESLRDPGIVAAMLVVVGIFMIIADRQTRPKKDKPVTNKQGITIGLAQVIALIPGTSRSGITITAGVFSGLSRQEAARFSFLLAIPIVAASGLGIFISDVDTSSLSIGPVFIGLLAAFVSGLFAIRFMLKWISKLGLTPFAIYRFVLAVLVLIFLV